MDSVSLTAPFDPVTPATEPGLNSGNYALGKFYNAFEDRIGSVVDYSDLEYTQIDLSVGCNYDFTDRLYTTANLTYSDFDSGEEYVYGDESGEAYYGFVGVGYRF
ncbi:MAG: hypothetical protein OET90_08770 [Desulfuromonadales bacterium]|nr:hypothetical protein [Desulfuromonadales bacterium]